MTIEQLNQQHHQISMTGEDMNRVIAFQTMLEMTLHGGKDIDEHIFTLFSLVLAMKPSAIIELGVRTGRSTFPFLFAGDLVDAEIFSVDKTSVQHDVSFADEWKSRWTFYEKDAIKFLENDLPEIMNSDKVVRSGRSKVFYIDDWHSGDHVARELELISEFVTPKDLIILHDLMYYNSEPNYRCEQNPKDPQWANGGPYQAISELDLGEWEYSTIPRCNGLTILRKKAEEVYTD
jgi:cephalosporin hydroxylase